MPNDGSEIRETVGNFCWHLCRHSVQHCIYCTLRFDINREGILARVVLVDDGEHVWMSRLKILIHRSAHRHVTIGPNKDINKADSKGPIRQLL
jgi:Zn-finger protein